MKKLLSFVSCRFSYKPSKFRVAPLRFYCDRPPPSLPNHPGPLAYYKSLVNQGKLKHDSYQEKVAFQLENLLGRLDQKQVTDDPDRWEWKPEANKSFTVRSAYELLLKRKMEFNVGLKKLCKLIWENSAIPRAQATAWRLLFSRLATRIELRRRGVLQVQSDVTCPLCSQSEEAAEHLFFNCSRTVMLWRSCLRWIGVHAPMNIDARVNLLHFCSLGSSKRHCSLLATLWVCTIWSIWKARNEVVFNSGDWKHDKILGEIKAHLWAWVGGKGEYLKLNYSFQDWCFRPWKNLGLS